MRKCQVHREQEASYLCLFSECREWKNQNYYLCQECILQMNEASNHHKHSELCFLIKDLMNQLQGQRREIESKEIQIEKNIGIWKNQLELFKKKKKYVIGLLEKLNGFNQAIQTIIGPDIMSNLEMYVLKPKQLKSDVETYQVQYEKLAENVIECDCKADSPVKFLRIEKDINLGKRTICDNCLGNNQSKQPEDNSIKQLSINEARKIIQQAEQEELYINELTRIKQEQRLIQDKMTQTFNKLEILDNYKSMYFNEALTVKRRSVKNILNEDQSRSQYQKLADFLSSYQKPLSEERFDFRELTNVFACFKTIYGLLDDLNKKISNFDVFQQGFVYTVICEIYKFENYEQTKILIIKETIKVCDFMNLITQLLPSLRQKNGITLNQQALKKIQNIPLLQIITNYGTYGKLKLIY